MFRYYSNSINNFLGQFNYQCGPKQYFTKSTDHIDHCIMWGAIAHSRMPDSQLRESVLEYPLLLFQSFVHFRSLHDDSAAQMSKI